MSKNSIKCKLGGGCDVSDKKIHNEVFDSVKKIENATGEGNQYLGWLDLPKNYNKEELQEIKEVATEIRKNADVLLVIGIGGSYLGSRAVIESQKGVFYNEINNTKIYFLGTSLDETYISQVLEIIKDKDVYVNVISKSGTTLEPAVAFRIVKNALLKKYSKQELKKRIIATTDSKKGALKKLASEEGFRTFIVPDDIGGRYSVFTPVGLLPIAVAGIDIDKLFAGARQAMDDFCVDSLENPCYKYVVTRNVLYRMGYSIEVFTNYNPSFVQFNEWLKQLFGESEGKDGKGLYPSSMIFTTDLHSLGQYIQDGKKGLLFKTELKIESSENNISVPNDDKNYDGLNYIAGKSVKDLNLIAQEGVYIAHENGGVPQITISIPKNSAYYLGMLIYFFEKACAVSAYTLGVNPFNQPGVEEYKSHMFRLLGK